MYGIDPGRVAAGPGWVFNSRMRILSLLSLDHRAPSRRRAVVACLALGLLWLTSACSHVRRGPELGKGGLELIYRIAPRPERAGQDDALAGDAVRIIRQRLEAAGCRGEVEVAGSLVRVRLPGGCGDPTSFKRLIALGGRLELREVDEGEALATLIAGTTLESGVTFDTERWGGPDGAAHGGQVLRGPIPALERARAGLAQDARLKDAEPLLEAPARPEEPGVLRLVRREAALSGTAVRTAEVVRDGPNMDRPGILISFTKEGGEAFARLTARLVGRKLAIVVDGRIASAPVVQAEIRGGSARITMGGSVEPAALLAQAKELAIALQAGALPVVLELLEEDVYPRPALQELRLAAEGQALVITLSTGGRWRVPSPPAPADLAPIMEAARAASRRPRLELLIRGAHDLPQSVQIAVSRAIADAGGEGVFCQKDNRNCR